MEVFACRSIRSDSVYWDVVLPTLITERRSSLFVLFSLFVVLVLFVVLDLFVVLVPPVVRVPLPVLVLFVLFIALALFALPVPSVHDVIVSALVGVRSPRYNGLRGVTVYAIR